VFVKKEHGTDALSFSSFSFWGAASRGKTPHGVSDTCRNR
jgi:hypothetical protein